jgi:glycosyltransferase involved in cell wall biosynthesis
MAKIVVLIPAFNEAGKIAEVVRRIRDVVPDYPILVVNDGSRDATADEARTAGALVVSHPFNMGYGAAIQTGYKYAWANGYDFLVQIDGDGQHDPAYIPALLAPIMAGETDVSVGSRFLNVDSYRPSFCRQLGITFFRILVSLLMGQRITDPTSGYQAFNRTVIRFFTSEYFPCDYPDADVLLTLHLACFKVGEVPVRMYANQEGKSMHNGLKPLYYVFKMCLAILVTMLRSHRLYREGRNCKPVNGER